MAVVVCYDDAVHDDDNQKTESTSEVHDQKGECGHLTTEDLAGS